MAIRKSQQDCVNRYILNHYARINLTMPPEKKDAIQKQAAANGESVNAFINRAIDLLLDSYEDNPN